LHSISKAHYKCHVIIIIIILYKVYCYSLLQCIFTLAIQDRIDGITQAADEFVDKGHFDAENIKEKQKQLLDRYEALQDPMQARRIKLRDALRLQQFFRDVEDEEDWIREKEPIASSTNRGTRYVFKIKNEFIILNEVLPL